MADQRKGAAFSGKLSEDQSSDAGIVRGPRAVPQEKLIQSFQILI